MFPLLQEQGNIHYDSQKMLFAYMIKPSQRDSMGTGFCSVGTNDFISGEYMAAV